MPESYPSIPAGRRITSGLLTAMLPVTARKTTDTSRSSTATPAPDEHLLFSVEANAVYAWEGWLKYFADPAADLQVDFTVPAGSLGEWNGFGAGSGTAGVAVTAGYMIRTEANDVSQTRNYYGSTDSTHGLLLHGLLRVGSTAGTFSLDWSQGTSNAIATVVHTDSWLRLQRIA